MKRKLSAIVMCIVIMLVSVMPAYAVKNNINFKTKTDIFYLVNLDTDTVVYSKNSDKKCYPASTTKIMTYIIVSENISDVEGTKVEVKQDVLDRLAGTDSSLAGVQGYVGAELSILQLLKCMMISSGNDAAEVLADYVGGGDTDKFVNLMNAKAAELECRHTHFVNAHGLHDNNQYTTAEDMSRIARYAMTRPYFMDITNTVEYYVDGDAEEPLINTNKMINPDEKDYYYKYAKGIKTGTTDEAGHCLVSTALKDNVSYMCIAYNAPCYDADGEWEETNYAMLESKKIYEWAYKNVTMREVLGNSTPVGTVNVRYGEGADKVNLIPEYAYSTMFDKNIKDTDIVISAKCQNEIDAPVKRGTVLGTATVSYKGEELTKVNLIAEKDVNKSDFLYFKAVAENVIKNPLFIAIAVIVLLLFVIYVIFVVSVSEKKNKDKK